MDDYERDEYEGLLEENERLEAVVDRLRDELDRLRDKADAYDKMMNAISGGGVGSQATLYADAIQEGFDIDTAGEYSGL